MGKISGYVKKGMRFLCDKDYRFIFLAKWGKYDDMPDEEYVKRMFKSETGHELDLENPQRLSEKLQWLKLYYRKPEYTMMADKYEVKKYVADLIGEEHVLPALAVWDSVDQIDLDSLPNQFVLKCTHDSGGYVICKNKETFDLKAAKKKLAKSLKTDYYLTQREWQYKNIKRRIIAEPYLDSLGKPDSIEYKFSCADGKVCFGTICIGVAHAEISDRTNDHYDRNFQPMPFYNYYQHSANPFKEKPAHYDEMFAYAEKISAGIPGVRVDFYVHEDNAYFGEITFYTDAGLLRIVPDEWDYKLGEFLQLPSEKILAD